MIRRRRVRWRLGTLGAAEGGFVEFTLEAGHYPSSTTRFPLRKRPGRRLRSDRLGLYALATASSLSTRPWLLRCLTLRRVRMVTYAPFHLAFGTPPRR